jgi:hypothetical protein
LIPNAGKQNQNHKKYSYFNQEKEKIGEIDHEKLSFEEAPE